MAKFTKDSLSQNKSIPSAIPPEFILGLGDVLAIGQVKYGRFNWAKCPTNKLYLYEDALLRHVLAYLSGEEFDEETGLCHLYHAGCNLAFLDYFRRNKNEQE